MRLLSPTGSILLLAIASAARQPIKRSYTTHDYYVLEHDPSASASPEEVAYSLGTEMVEQVGELPHHWLIRLEKDRSRTDDPVAETYHSIRRRATSPNVAGRWWNRDIHQARRIAASIRSITLQVPRQRTKRWLTHPELPSLDPRIPPPPVPSPANDRLEQVKKKLNIQDPSFPQQWHLLNTQTPPHDMNVSGVWEMGYTGKGVIAAIVDDGLDFTSDDLSANFVSIIRRSYVSRD